MRARREVATIERRFAVQLAQHRVRRRRWQRVRRDAEIIADRRERERQLTIH